jgi:fermentation-respiration switch protein FrsA (DUF1100 family)
MKNTVISITGISLGLILISSLLAFGQEAKSKSFDPAQDGDIEGVWLGTLKVSVAELRIVFKINKNTDGTLVAKMDSPDQGAENIPINKVTFENGKLFLESKIIQGSYDGRMTADGSIEGTWRQIGRSFPLVLKHVDEAPKLHRPQEPKKPYPYIEEEVSYKNEKAGIKLSGTLTLPRAGQSFPAVILISGSGPQDRNETVLGHRPFLVLADYLTRQGIAVLRVDDRGVGGSTGNLFESTSQDLAEDVLAGVQYLKSREQINPKSLGWLAPKIGLIGHSEGGIVAPIVAIQSSDIAFIVLMAGLGVTGQEILYLQSELLLKAAGASDEILAVQRAGLKQIFEILKNEKDGPDHFPGNPAFPALDRRSANSTVDKKKLREVLMDTLGKLSEKEKESLGASEGTVEVQLQMILSRWFRFFIAYDPKPTLMKVKCPVLAINGELDLQVPPKENLTAIAEALEAGGNTNYTIQEMPKLNHLFQKAQTGAISEYAKIEETISPIALDVIAKWILKQTR